MNELILLCAGAAADSDPDARGGMEPPRSARLDTLLARGGVAHDRSLAGNPLPELPEDHFLRELFGVPPGVAIEALAGAALGMPLPYWRLTPCHLHLGMDHAMLTDPPQLQLSADDAQALVATIAPSFAELGLTLLAPRPDVWFVHGEPWALQAHPWTQASGRNIAAYQPSGARARDWRRLLTEVQMLWHEHPVNQARAARGLRAVNALWLDGFASAYPPPGAGLAGTGLIFTDSPALAGLGAAAGWQVGPLAAFGAAPLTGPGSLSAGEGTTLIDLDWWRAPRRLGDLGAWRTAWTQLDGWLAEHAARLAQAGRSHPIRVVLTGERRVLELSASAPAGWRFWRRFDAHAAIAGGARRAAVAR